MPFEVEPPEVTGAASVASSTDVAGCVSVVVGAGCCSGRAESTISTTVAMAARNPTTWSQRMLDDQTRSRPDGVVLY